MNTSVTYRIIIELPERKHSASDVNEMKNALRACFVTARKNGKLEKIWFFSRKKSRKEWMEYLQKSLKANFVFSSVLSSAFDESPFSWSFFDFGIKSTASSAAILPT